MCSKFFCLFAEWTRQFLTLHLELFFSTDLSKKLNKLSEAYVLFMILNWNSLNLMFKVVSKGKVNIRFHCSLVNSKSFFSIHFWIHVDFSFFPLLGTIQILWFGQAYSFTGFSKCNMYCLFMRICGYYPILFYL